MKILYLLINDLIIEKKNNSIMYVICFYYIYVNIYERIILIYFNVYFKRIGIRNNFKWIN